MKLRPAHTDFLGTLLPMSKRASTYEFRTPFGLFCLRATSRGLYSLEVVQNCTRGGGGAKPSGVNQKIPSRTGFLLRKTSFQICSYLAGKKVDFRRFPVDWTGLGRFEKRVLQELRKIPWGKTQSYQFLAVKTGKPKAARYVGQILHLNRLPLIVPCHRIVLKRGGLGGFSRGVRWKKRLLKLETRGADTKAVDLTGADRVL